MTQHKRLNRKIRERMAKTGEPYTTARLNLIGGEQRPPETPPGPANDTRPTRPVPFVFVDGRPPVVREVETPLPQRQRLRHPVGPGLAQAAAGIRGEYIVDFELMQDVKGDPVYVEFGAPVTSQAVQKLLDNVRPSFMDFAKTFRWAEARLYVLDGRDGTYWIEFSWKNSVNNFCRISSGWIMPDNRQVTYHRMAFVEQVVDRMNLEVFGVGSNPANDGQTIQRFVIPPQFWSTKARKTEGGTQSMSHDEIQDRIWEPLVIFKALFPKASYPRVEFENGEFVIGPGNRSVSSTPDSELRRAVKWEDAIRAVGLDQGIDPARIERMIVEAKRARREQGSPFFGDDDERKPS
jgi:hypothetical protein